MAHYGVMQCSIFGPGAPGRRSTKRYSSCFCARQHMISAHMLSQFRPSVCPSVTRVDQSKTAEVRITQFSPYSSPIPLVFARQVSFRNSDGLPLSGGIKQGWGRKNSQFSANKLTVSQKRCKIGPKLLLMTNRKLHTPFRLMPKSMTLDDPERPIHTHSVPEKMRLSEPTTKN